MNVLKKSLLLSTALLLAANEAWTMEDRFPKAKMPSRKHAQHLSQLNILQERLEDQQGIEDRQRTIEIPEDFLIPFLRGALRLSRDSLPTAVNTDIKEDLIEGPDNKDYIRLLNMKHLFEKRRQDFNTQQQFHWLVNFSRQVDALNIHEGSLREMITPINNDGIFWRRLSYLHHGLTNKDLNPEVRNYVIGQLWKSDDLHNLEALINAFFNHNIFKLRSESLQVRGIWLDRIIKVLAWPSLVPLSWYSDSNISLSERIKNFHTLLKHYDSKGSLESDSEEDTDKNEYMMIHPYLRGNNHPEHDVKIFGKTLQTIKRRAREINRDTYDRKAASQLNNEIAALKKEVNDLQNSLRNLKKRKTDSDEEEGEKKREVDFVIENIRDRKEKRSQKEHEWVMYSQKIDTALMELVDDFEQFGCTQLESHSHKFRDFYREIERLDFSSISFYIGLLNEFEHLSISNNYLTKLLDNFSPSEHEVIFQGIAITAEALNNVFLPLGVCKEIQPIREIFKFFRNKIIEHKTNFIKRKLNQLSSHPGVEHIFAVLYQDLQVVREKILLRLNWLKHIIDGEGDWQKDIERLKKDVPSKATEVEDIEWTDWGLPTLSGFMRYFIYSNVLPKEILTQDRSLINEIHQRVKKTPNTNEDREAIEASTLHELRSQTEEMSALMESSTTFEELRNRLEHDLNFRLKFFRILNNIKESFCYLSENMEEEYLSQILSVFDEQVLWYLYYDLRDRRNLITHDLWRNDINGVINTALRIQNILKPAIMRTTPSKYYLNSSKDLEATKKLFKALQFPSSAKSIDKIRQILEFSQADVNGVDSEDHTPLFFAVRAKNNDLIELLLSHGAIPNLFVNPQILYLNPGKDMEATKQLFRFIKGFFKTGNLNEVSLLLNSPQTDINGIDSKGYTPLFYAVSAENKHLVELLLNHGANPNVLINRQGDTVLHIVLNNLYKKSIVKLLLQHGALADIRNAHGETPYGIVLSKMPTDISTRNFPRYQLPDTGDDDNPYTILELLKSQQSYQRGLEADELHSSVRLASSRNVTEKLTRLLEEGYDLNLYDEYGEIPLCLALGRRFTSEDSLRLLSPLLTQSDLNINLKNYIGIQESALHLAAQRKSTAIAQLLVQSGADPSLPNAEKTTPLHYAVGFRNIPLASFFLEKGANVHARDYLGLTPILVSSHNQIEMLELLLQKRANPNDRDELGGTIFENNEGMLESESLDKNDLVSILKTRKLLLQHGAYPIVRMTPYIFNTISYTLNECFPPHATRKAVVNAALQEFEKTYDFIRGGTRLYNYLSSHSASSPASQVEAEKNKLIHKKIERYKKFVYIIGSSVTQDHIAQTMARVINNANVTENERKKFLQLIPGYETIIADLETESLQSLVRLNEELLEKESDDDSSSEKSFIEDSEVTQQLLRQLLLDSTGLDNSLSIEDILSCISLKPNILPKPLIGRYKLKSFLEERQKSCATLPKRRTTLRSQYFFFNDSDQLSYFGYNAKMRRLILEKTSFLSHLPSIKALISQDNGIFGRNTVEVASHTWRPYGNQIKIQLWDVDPDTRRLCPCEVLGPSNNDDVLHFLKVAAHNSPEHYIPLDQLEYDYTDQDIRRLIQLALLEQLGAERVLRFGINESDNLYQLNQDDPFHELVIHQIDNKFILPSAESAPGFSLEKYVQHYLKKLKAEKLFNSATTEIIFPYNPEGHWVTIHVRVDNENLLISYVDSLRYKEEHLRHIRENIITDSLQTLKGVLKLAYGIKATKEAREVGRIEIVYKRLQENGHLCGVLAIENIIDIIVGRNLQSSVLFNGDMVNNLRIQHHRRLLNIGLNLDFDEAEKI